LSAGLLPVLKVFQPVLGLPSIAADNFARVLGPRRRRGRPLPALTAASPTDVPPPRIRLLGAAPPPPLAAGAAADDDARCRIPEQLAEAALMYRRRPARRAEPGQLDGQRRRRGSA
jgi:hypothetical protein